MIFAGIPTEFKSPTIGPGGIPVSCFSTIMSTGATSPGFAGRPASVFFNSENTSKELYLDVETKAG